MMCKIVRLLKLMWQNIRRSTNSQTSSVIEYIDGMQRSQALSVADSLILPWVVQYTVHW